MRELLTKLGLTETEAKTFQILFAHGEMTVYELARLSNINRTSSYRILEKLEKEGFVVKVPKTKRIKYKVSGLEYIKQKVDQKKIEATTTSNLLEKTLPDLEKLRRQKQNEIDVIYYTGKEEVKQLLWNTLQAKGILRAYGFKSTREAVGSNFLIRWWNEMVERGFEYRMLANPSTFKEKYKSNKISGNRYKKPHYWNIRSIDEKTLSIKHEAYIYNDIYAILQWDNKQIFGAEIHNQIVADQQKIFYDLLWEKAKEYNNTI